ncbi:hypothetical protein [Desulfovirgula thermocuniculi]|uniref:hypothetical protein n=1 Tax=Desulfovirgula thermocuniculi TaxID=348842 RepID=UPI000403C780|nr:hypothetical protein [Desulfovirgula thermocuniculi]
MLPGPGAGEGSSQPIRARVRLDFKGVPQKGRLFWGNKPVEKVAEEAREQQVTYWRHVPIQGVHISDVDMGLEVYTIYDDVSDSEVAYAPVVLEVIADSLEDLVRFVVREDFRKIEIISPTSLTLGKHEMEKLMFRIFEEFTHYRRNLERKLNVK